MALSGLAWAQAEAAAEERGEAMVSHSFPGGIQSTNMSFVTSQVWGNDSKLVRKR